jgi:hypothetical protein
MRAWRLWPVVLAMLAASCGDANELTGSISQQLPLDFDKVRIRKQQTDLLIEYVKGKGASQETVCRVVLDTDNLPLQNGAIIKDELFLQRVKLQRAAEGNAEFPDLTGGQLKFEIWEFRQGGTIKGEFSVVFVNGHTLFGTFEDKVEEVQL